MLNKTQVFEKFNNVANRYDLMAAFNPGYSKHLRWSARRLGLGKDSRILDLCCGTGLSTKALCLEYPNAKIDALDASEGMLERARAKSYPGAEVHFVHGDAMDPKAAGIVGPYDGILMAYGIRNVPDADLCLRRLFELLKPGGRLCLHEYSVADSLSSKVVWNAVSWGVIIPLWCA